jgi:hypothetical protein
MITWRPPRERNRWTGRCGGGTLSAGRRFAERRMMRRAWWPGVFLRCKIGRTFWRAAGTVHGCHLGGRLPSRSGVPVSASSPGIEPGPRPPHPSRSPRGANRDGKGQRDGGGDCHQPSQPPTLKSRGFCSATRPLRPPLSAAQPCSANCQANCSGPIPVAYWLTSAQSAVAGRRHETVMRGSSSGRTAKTSTLRRLRSGAG